jgi:starch synthase
MTKPRVLYVSQEIFPYLPESEMSNVSRYLPQGIQEKGKEIRTFMPRFGCINERRHQLHEVIRLSGMNLIIDDHDHPLIIKVASIQQARMQVYFIDNEEYFKRKSVFQDSEGEIHSDNHERMMFFGKGVLETVKKLSWAPDIIHCHGWFTSMIPLFIKTAYQNDPIFANSKIVFSAYENPTDVKKVNRSLFNKIQADGIDVSEIEALQNPSLENLEICAAQHADAVVFGSEIIDSAHKLAMTDKVEHVLEYQGAEDYVDAYDEFYDNILEESSVLMD